MRLTSRTLALLASISSLVSSVKAISNITRDGRYLYNPDGSRFYIKGVAYQEQGNQNISISIPSMTDYLLRSGSAERWQ